MTPQVVIIHPRADVSAQDIATWLEANFQEPGGAMGYDAGPKAKRTITIKGGNPLVNAWITVAS